MCKRGDLIMFSLYVFVVHGVGVDMAMNVYVKFYFLFCVVALIFFLFDMAGY